MTTRVELDRYREAGFFCREQVFSEVELAELREAVEGIHKVILDAAARDDAPPVDRVDRQRYQMLLGSTVKWEWRESAEEIRSMEPCHHLDPRLDGLIDDPRMWNPVRSVLGSEGLSLFSSKLNFKRPGGSPFPWHQESPYWVHGAEQSDHLVNALLCLDDTTKENGCLWVIPASHKHGMLPCLENRGVLGRLYTDVERFGAEAAIPVEAPAGSVLYFHQDLVHGSQTNRSGESRRVLVFAYQPAGWRQWRLHRNRPIDGA